MIWRAREHEFRFPRPGLVMGVLNVTPDSFSDGGRFLDPAAAAARAFEMAAAGAEIIDIGGESTRPGATPVSTEEELRRVLPVIQKLAGTIPALISIDTQKPEVAAQAVAAGARIINDIGATRMDPAMRELVARTGAGYIAMHMQGTPETMQKQPAYERIVEEIRRFFDEQLAFLTAGGVAPEQIALDVGIGFGKTPEHNLELLAHIDEARAGNRPLVLGVSRKSFMGRVLGCAVGERLPPALACSIWAAGRGVEIFRAHDVAETKLALRMLEAVQTARDHAD